MIFMDTIIENSVRRVLNNMNLGREIKEEIKKEMRNEMKVEVKDVSTQINVDYKCDCINNNIRKFQALCDENGRWSCDIDCKLGFCYTSIDKGISVIDNVSTSIEGKTTLFGRCYTLFNNSFIYNDYLTKGEKGGVVKVVVFIV